MRRFRVAPAPEDDTGAGTVVELCPIMAVIASRSKLWGHFVLVTGSRKGRRVRGHFREMRSRSMATSSSDSGEALCGCCCLVARREEYAVWSLEVVLEVVVGSSR
jgi:hypothetical protein